MPLVQPSSTSVIAPDAPSPTATSPAGQAVVFPSGIDNGANNLCQRSGDSQAEGLGLGCGER